MANVEDRLYLSHLSAISACHAPRMSRSRSTPSLENQPGVVTRITHTRYIRAGSAEPHRSIYSVFSNLDGKRRASSVSATDSWSRGSSMSRGSSTESLMTMAEVRKKREGSPESMGSTRSLKVISARSISTGVTRRGAKLNKDIHAPWVSSEYAPRVITPSLPAVGAASSQSTTPTHGSTRAGSAAHKPRRASIEIPKHLEEIEKRLGITPKFKSAPDVNVESRGRISPRYDRGDVPFNDRDGITTYGIVRGDQPLDAEADHVTCERASEVHARVGIRRRHTDLPERVARSRAKAEEEEARREREKEASKEPAPPPPSPVGEPEDEVNKTNGVFTGGESDIQENTGQKEEVEEELTTETQPQALLVETDIDRVVTQLDIDNPTPSKKRKVERTSEGEQEEQERENKDGGADVSLSFKMEGNPGPTPTPGAEGGSLHGAGAGAAGGPVPSHLLETEINYPSLEPHSIFPGGQGFVGEEDEDDEFEIEVEVVPESYMENPVEEEEEEPEFDQTHWQPDIPSYDDSDYYSYISESFERRDRIIRAMREQEMEMEMAPGETLSPQSSIDESEYSAYDDYVIPYISKKEPPARHSMDLSDYSDEFGQVPQYHELDSHAPPSGSRAVSDSMSQPPAIHGESEIPVNKHPQEDTARLLRKPQEKPLSPEQKEALAEGKKRGESNKERLTQGSSQVGEDQRVPEIVGVHGEGREAISQPVGAEGDKNASGLGAAGKTSLNEPLIIPTDVPKVASKPEDQPSKKPLRGILKRSGSTDSYHSRDGDVPAPQEQEPSLKRYSYTEDLSIVEEVVKSVIDEIPDEQETKKEGGVTQPSATLPKGKEIIPVKPYYETDIDKSEHSESKKNEKPKSEVKEEPVVPEKDKMAETEKRVLRKRQERTTFPTFSEISAVDIRDSNTLDYKMRLTILDIIMNFLLITPLVVLHYHALSTLLELVFLQYFPKIGTLLLLCLGIAVEFGCIFFQKSIASCVPLPNSSPDAENIQFILASKAFYFVLAFGNISHMLAASEIIDLYIGDDFSSSFKTAVTSLIVLWVLRCGRNVIAPPLYVSIDHDDVGVFSTRTLFKTEHDGSTESGVDTLATTAMVFTFVHLHWAGVWNCLDSLFFPGTFWLSMMTSLSIGYGLCLVFLFLQDPALKVSRNLQREGKEPLRIVFENVFNGAANIGVVLLWKGLWMVYDVMADYFPIYCRSWDITPLATTVLSFVLLSLAHCSSSLLFQDCEIDGELKDGEGVLFQTGYLSEIIGDVTKESSGTSPKEPTDAQPNKTPTSTKQPSGVTSTETTAAASVSKPLQPTKTKSRDVTATSPNGATQPKQKVA